jgi:hypothetical protein
LHYRFLRRYLTGPVEPLRKSTVFPEVISKVSVPLVPGVWLRISAHWPTTRELETVPKKTFDLGFEPDHQRQLPTCLR